MKKQSIVKALSRLPGFKKAGSFYIGHCDREVISGYALDAAPTGSFIWRFVLPGFDRIEFLHMSLGRRIAAFVPADNPSIDGRLINVDQLLAADWRELSAVRDCASLLTYLDQEHFDGEYGRWARYLTCIYIGKFEDAESLEQGWRSLAWPPRLPLIVQNWQAVEESRVHSGWQGAQELLKEWSKHTTSRFCT